MNTPVQNPKPSPWQNQGQNFTPPPPSPALVTPSSVKPPMPAPSGISPEGNPPKPSISLPPSDQSTKKSAIKTETKELIDEGFIGS